MIKNPEISTLCIKCQNLFCDFNYIWIFPSKSGHQISWKWHVSNIPNLKIGFSTISNVQNLNFSQIWQAEMSILVKNCMSFWWENSNVVEIRPNNPTFKIFHLYSFTFGSEAVWSSAISEIISFKSGWRFVTQLEMCLLIMQFVDSTSTYKVIQSMSNPCLIHVQSM